MNTGKRENIRGLNVDGYYRWFAFCCCAGRYQQPAKYNKDGKLIIKGDGVYAGGVVDMQDDSDLG